MVAVHPALHAHAKPANNTRQDRKTSVETPGCSWWMKVYTVLWLCHRHQINPDPNLRNQRRMGSWKSGQRKKSRGGSREVQGALTRWLCVCSCRAHRGCWGSRQPGPGSGDGGNPRDTSTWSRSPRWYKCHRCGRGWTCTRRCPCYNGGLERRNNTHWAAFL